MEEYCALETVRVAANFDGIADARLEKPKREVDQDVRVPEMPVFQEGAENDDTGRADVPGSDERANVGLRKLGQSCRPAHRFATSVLHSIMRFETREKNTKFSKALCNLPFDVLGRSSRTA